MISNLLDQLHRDEGLRLDLYKDSVGKWTIGVGRNLSDDGISLEEADFLLASDVKRTTAALESVFPWTMDLDDVRKGALLNMAFNMGIRGLAEFKDFLGKMQAQDFTGAAHAMLDSLWAKEVGDRAQRLSIQVQTGSWQ